MLTQHKLLIDQNCPLCNAYGQCFIRYKLIDPAVMDSYQQVDQSIFDKIDEEKAKSEIALLNENNSQVYYGIDAMIHILFPKKGIFYRILMSKPIYFLLRNFYGFISYNRHVIAGGSHTDYSRTCIPETHKMYRWSYILLVALLTAVIVNSFTVQLDQAIGMEHQFWREYLVCFGQISWQFVAVGWIDRSKRLDYLGNMSTVSMIGALLLLPIILIASFINIPALGLLLLFGCVVGIMFILHVRRAKQLGLPFIVSISWVIYRSVVLGLILLFI